MKRKILCCFCFFIQSWRETFWIWIRSWITRRWQDRSCVWFTSSKRRLGMWDDNWFMMSSSFTFHLIDWLLKFDRRNVTFGRDCSWIVLLGICGCLNFVRITFHFVTFWEWMQRLRFLWFCYSFVRRFDNRNQTLFLIRFWITKISIMSVMKMRQRDWQCKREKKQCNITKYYIKVRGWETNTEEVRTKV